MTFKLVVESGPLLGHLFNLEEAAEWTIGRDPDLCNIALEDPTASREHLRLRLTTGGYLVENLSSTNPALLNGRQLTDIHLLEEGDQLQVGNSLFQYTAIEPAAPLAHWDEEIEEEEEAPSPEEIGEDYETLYQGDREAIPAETEVFEEGLGRWLLKVISGPNSGAELSLESGRSYLIGTDAGSCDIVLYDLSVSRQHARIIVSDQNELIIEDLHSRNGVIVNGEKREGRFQLRGNAMVSLGTTSFIVIDREGAQETVVSSLRLPPTFQPAEEVREEIRTFEPGLAAMVLPAPISSQDVIGQRKRKSVLSGGLLLALIITLSLLGVITAATFSLFRSKQVEIPHLNYEKKIEEAIGSFTGVRWSYTPASGTLLLVGHLLTPVDLSELLYSLQGLYFVRQIDDNIVVDQYVWQETNQILAKNPAWTGVSMHASQPGLFVITGYLQTRDQAASLQDYLLLSFPYVNQLQNQVVVEEILLDDIHAQLQNGGLMAVTPQLTNGEVTLTGYINTLQKETLAQVIAQFQQTPGIRVVRNFVVEVAPQEATSVVDLTGKYQVNGFSTRDNATVNVLINGRILSRGDQLDGMTITGIQSNAIYLEKDGVKYKINYNQ